MPLISVLMPVYNAEKFLADAILSILNQSFTDFEFIIIDDYSTDRSAAIIQSYSDPRIRFFQNEQNLGISATLNKGIELATAEYIARMDADDISYPERLEKQFSYAMSNPDCVLISTLARVVDKTGQFVRQDIYESAYFYYNLTFFCWIYHPTVLYQKKTVQEVGMYAVPYAEDYELFWQLTRRYKFYNLPEVLLDYRVTSQSLHQVLKKQEYDVAQREQMLRNFRYYTGPDFTLPDNYLDCLQHNFESLLAERRAAPVLACIKKLDYITGKILVTENINRDVEAIQEAASYKRLFILETFARKLPPHKGVWLLLRAGSYKLLIKIIITNLLRKVNLSE